MIPFKATHTIDVSGETTQVMKVGNAYFRKEDWEESRRAEWHDIDGQLVQRCRQATVEELPAGAVAAPPITDLNSALERIRELEQELAWISYSDADQARHAGEYLQQCIDTAMFTVEERLLQAEKQVVDLSRKLKDLQGTEPTSQEEGSDDDLEGS